MPEMITDAEEELMLTLANRGVHLAEISRQVGRPPSTVTGFLTRMNVRAGAAPKPSDRLLPLRDEIIAKYRGGANMAALSKEYRCTYETLYRIMELGKVKRDRIAGAPVAAIREDSFIRPPTKAQLMGSGRRGHA